MWALLLILAILLKITLAGNVQIDENGVITDRRAGRNIEKKDALAVAKELEEKIKLSEQGASVLVLPTIGHRVQHRPSVCKS